MPRAIFLVPGVGAQGGRAADLGARARRAPGLGPGDRIAVDRGRPGPRGCRGRAARRALGASRAASELARLGRACGCRPATSGSRSIAAATSPGQPTRRARRSLGPRAAGRHGATSHPDEVEPDPIARILAVFALVAVAIVLVVVVSGSIGGSGDGRRRQHAQAGDEPAEKYYVVQPGDTFGGIATRRGSRSPGSRSSTPTSTLSSCPRRDAWTWCPTGARCSPTGAEPQAPRRLARSRLLALAGARPRWPAAAARRTRRRRRSRPAPGSWSTPATARAWPPRSPDRSLPMASTTKLMTAYLALRELPLDERLVAPAYHPIPGESLLGLEPGERMSVRDLLYGLLLPSGNDAAVTLADGVAGSIPAFVAQMNRAARRLGLRRHELREPDRAGPARQLLEPARPREARARPAPRRAVQADRRHAARHAPHRRPPADGRQPQRPRGAACRGSTASRRATRSTPATSWSAPATRKGVTLLSVVMGAPSDARPRRRHAGAARATGSRSTAGKRPCGRARRLAPPAVPNGDASAPLVAGRAVQRDRAARAERSTSRSTRPPQSIEAPIRRGATGSGAPRSRRRGGGRQRAPLVAGARRRRRTPGRSSVAGGRRAPRSARRRLDRLPSAWRRSR